MAKYRVLREINHDGTVYVQAGRLTANQALNLGHCNPNPQNDPFGFLSSRLGFDNSGVVEMHPDQAARLPKGYVEPVKSGD